MFVFNNWFWDRLSSYFQEEDSYKDNQGQGLLERYLKIFGEDLDEVVLPLMLDYIKTVDPLESADFANQIIDPSNVDNQRFLNHIAYTLGLPPDLTNDDYYRKVLQFAIALYQIKGTIPSYEIWADMVGIQLSIYEVEPKEVRYDSGFNYDTIIQDILSETPTLYDSVCPTCSEYVIAIEGLSIIPEEQLELLNQIISLNEPINAKLIGIIPRIFIEDTIPLCMVEDINIRFVEGGAYDDNLTEYDGSEKYDLPVITRTLNINQACEVDGSMFDRDEFDNTEFDNID